MKNLFKNSVYAAAALVLALGAASCSDSDGDYTFADEREEALKNAAVDFVDNNVIPTYKALADGSIALQEDCEAMLEAFDAGTLTTPLVQAACNDWITTRKHWELSEAYLYGAAADYDIDPHIDSWPLDGTALQNLLNNNSMMAEIERNPDYVSANLGYGLLGFHALEYMLFENAGPRALGKYTRPQLVYLVGVANDLCNMCVRLEASWAGLDNVTEEKQTILGVMIQNSFRSNFSIIGILLATALGGAEGGSIAASMQAPTIIYFNVVSVLCLIYFSDQPQRRVSPGYILKSIATNPMILGQVVGLACLIARQWIPRDASGELLFSIQGSLPFLYSAVDSLASMATPLILVLMGGQVDFSAVGAMKKELIVGIVQRLILAPVIGFCLAFVAQDLGVFTLTPATVGTLVGVFGSPVASASAVMAEEMGGDGELARQYVVWTCALSMLTLLLWIVFLREFALL